MPCNIEDTVLGPLASINIKLEAGEVICPIRGLAPTGQHEAVLCDPGDVVRPADTM